MGRIVDGVKFEPSHVCVAGSQGGSAKWTDVAGQRNFMGKCVRR